VTRVAAIDCGTNTLRLLIADIEDAGVAVVERRTTIVRLGQGVDRTGVFAAEALGRTFAALDEYAEVIQARTVDRIRFVATSAARDVANRDRLIEGVRKRLGVAPDVISGDEEARLAYDGATRQLAGHPEIAAPAMVLDIGGGSTELVLGVGDGEIAGASMDIGSVRLTERHLHDDPPTRQQRAAARADIDEVLAGVGLPLAEAGSLIGVAGSILTIGAMVLDLSTYDRERVNLARLRSADVLAVCDRLVEMSIVERRALPFMHPDRADVIGAGALILARIVERVGRPELVTSAHDILDGIAWSMA
jgi:exopolyphosphatase/guanosine-5'-triphosphate,3'-diphosphate pyrophosphatase